MVNIRSRIQAWWKETSAGRKLVIGMAACLSLASIMFAGVSNLSPEYRTLFRGLEPEDASEIVEFLKQEHIPFKLAEGGSAIAVSESQVYDVRLQLAGKGLPKGKSVGFEIFDRNTLGATDFVQQLNYTRALQGELSRTISHLEQVEQATVHIARPKPSLFRRNPKPVTASVILKLLPGHYPGKSQVYGISHLVAGAVEGLDADHVTILDQRGRPLSKKRDSGMFEISPALELQKSLVKYLQENAQTMLDQVLGEGQAIVRVHVDMDFSKSKETREIYDPEKQVIISENIRTKKSTEGSPKGATGARAKVKGKSSSRKIREEKTEDREAQYALDRTIKEVENRIGGVKRLSLAVVIDSSLSEKMAGIGNLVKESTGFDSKRGDTFEITSLPFHKEDNVPEVVPFWQSNPQLLYLVTRQGVMALAILMFGITFIVLFKKSDPEKKKLWKAKGNSEEEGIDEKESIPGSEGKKIAQKALDEMDPLDLMIQEVRETAKNNTEGTSSVLRKWLYDDSQ